jgi:hypothetical protein
MGIATALQQAATPKVEDKGGTFLLGAFGLVTALIAVFGLSHEQLQSLAHNHRVAA